MAFYICPPSLSLLSFFDKESLVPIHAFILTTAVFSLYICTYTVRIKMLPKWANGILVIYNECQVDWKDNYLGGKASCLLFLGYCHKHLIFLPDLTNYLHIIWFSKPFFLIYTRFWYRRDSIPGPLCICSIYLPTWPAALANFEVMTGSLPLLSNFKALVFKPSTAERYWKLQRGKK
jgi:hypothetical protein